ncbi:TRAP transporter small permease [Parvularcula maris]|uniref:TRAP transporter small permease protein n=1 Tax=Parvularcula maris TaxID=2965077 RepID=A0A9X2LAJ3_9PROT|nr:TRAP transporter small permease subunit [Parvularcula maris]MCQ8186094.1 TRAP transporter small permease subunit [Parvularcula maris]
MTLVILWQVIGRYVFGDAPSWSEQLSLYLLLWSVLLASAAGVREGFHIRITAGQDRLPSDARKPLLLLIDALVLCLGVALLVLGADLVRRLWPNTIPTLGLPRGSAFIPMAVSGALIALFAAEKMAGRFVGRNVEASWP